MADRKLKIIIDSGGDASANITKMVGALGGILLLKSGLEAVGGAIADSVGKASDLSAQMSTIGARSGATADEVAGLKDLVSDLALDPDLKVSSFEAAAAIEELAAGGVEIKDIMAGAAEGTVALANAVGGDFGQAAEVAASSMSIFGVGAEDMTKVVDGVTAVVVASKFDLNDYALALAQAGGAAAISGVEMEDFNTTIAAIAPLFASGSDAGTSFKTFLQRLIPQSDDAADAMRELGLEFFDGEGNMKDMADIAGQLNAVMHGTFTVTQQVGGVTDEMGKAATKAEAAIPGLTTKIEEQQIKLGILQQELQGTIQKYGEGSTQAQNKSLAITKLNNDIAENSAKLGDHQAALDAVNNATTQTVTQTRTLSEEQRNAALTTIFGADAMRAAAGLAELTTEEYRALQEQMGQTSGADAAAMMMDNLAGDTEILKGVVEGLQISYGDKLLPKLRDLAQFATDYLGDKGPAFVESFANLSIKVLDLAQEAIPRIIAEFERFSSQMSTTAGPAMLLINDALTRIGAALGMDAGKTTALDVVIKVLGKTLDAVVIGVKAFAITMQGVAWATEKVSTAVKIAKQLWKDWDKIINSSSTNPAVVAIKALKDGLKGLLNPIGAAIDAWNRLKDAWRDAINAIPGDFMPGSPTPFELGLRGIVAATQEVGQAAPAAFSGFGGGGTPSLAGAGAGAGGVQVIVNLTYSPVVSMADRLEAERVLAPLIAASVRRELGTRG